MSENTGNNENTGYTNDLNDGVEVTVEDAQVITVPIDATLSNSGEAADAAAVGAALAEKADRSDLQTQVNVNGQTADRQGLIILLAGHIPVSDTQNAQTVFQALNDLGARTGADIRIDDTPNAETIREALSAATGRTAEAIRMSGASGAQTVAQAMAAINQTVSGHGEAITALDLKTGAAIKVNATDTETIEAAIRAIRAGQVLKVNGIGPDAGGDVILVTVPYAENLASRDTKEERGSFIRRTTAGGSSVSDGKAWLNRMLGNSTHEGFVAESLRLNVIPVERTPGEEITATIDRDTFVAHVHESGTYNLYFTTEWSEDPEDYGITVTGTPAAGDQLQAVYVKEERGAITQANPTALISTGWNLYEAANGYARVVRYSDNYGYKIGGTYTALTFKEDPEDAGTVITPDGNGLFAVPKDGYVAVTGGGAGTYILATWSDWTEGPEGGYEAYRESTVSLAAVMSECFPYGLMKAGEARDEIDRLAGTATSRVERKAYSAENRAEAEASGRQYELDEEYIYIERGDPVVTRISLSGEYTISDHGMEYIAGTAVPVYCEILYGENLVDKLRKDVVTISRQTLTSAEQTQVRNNISAASQTDVVTKSQDLVNNFATNDTTKAVSASAAKNFKDSLKSGAYKGELIVELITLSDQSETLDANSAGANKEITLTKSGYTAIGLAGYNTRQARLFFGYAYVSGGKLYYRMANLSNSSLTTYPVFYILWQKNS